MKVATVGAGSWGTALSCVLANNGHQVSLWVRDSTSAVAMTEQRRNTKYLPTCEFPSALTVTSELQEALRGAHLILFAVPSVAMHHVVEQTQGLIPTSALIVHAVKGFHPVDGRRMSQVISDLLGADCLRRLVALTGPSHAEEVATQLPTTVVAASHSKSSAESVQDALMNQFLRVYTNPDVIGAELGGALKNIIALAVGVADGLHVGDNAKAALMTRGLAEIARLGHAMGASMLTFAGLAGVGDLIVTCTSQHSRNFRAGRLIAAGMPVKEAVASIGMAVEGVPATQVALRLAERHGVEMPIAKALYAVLFEQTPPSDAVEGLMGRPRTHEVEEVALSPRAPIWQFD